MNTSAWIEALGWTLIHFVWQGALIAACLWAILQFARHARAQFRYWAGCVALLAAVAFSISTFAREIRAPRNNAQTAGKEAAAASVTTRGPVESVTQNPWIIPPADAAGVSSIPLPREKSSDSASAFPRIPGRLEWAVAILQRHTPSIVLLWLLGVCVFSIRLCRSWQVVRSLRRSGEHRGSTHLQERFTALCAAVGARPATRLLVSAAVRVPMVIGWLKPLVLIPGSILSGLSLAQVEAILAHELAHVRRNDYLVNLLQNAIETVFFYHPAIWWISGQIRKEREHCCDDIAAAATGGALHYVSALAALEESRVPAEARLALAATGGALLARARRLLIPKPSEGPAQALFAGGLALLLIAAVFVVTAVFLRAAEPATPEAKPGAAEARHEQTRDVLKLWRGEYKDAGAVPAEAMRRVAKQVTKFIEQSPGANAEKFRALLPRLEAEREWPWDEAATMLDQLCDIATGPVGWTELSEQFRAFNRVKKGEAWTTEALKALPFGPPNAQGLRAAWIFEPMQPAYAIGDVVKSRILIHNAGTEPIEFRTDAWHQEDRWNVIDASGKPVKVKTTWYTGITPLQRFRLDPGQVVEVPGHGAGIGAGDYSEKYSVGAIGAEIPAQPGDELRCTWDVKVKLASDSDPNAAALKPLRTGEVKFRVVAADPNAPKPPGVATSTGRYDLAPGIKLQVSQVTSGKDGEPTTRTNTATILWFDAANQNTLKWPIELPPGLNSYVIAWPRGGTAFWIGQAAAVRKIDFSNAANVREENWKREDGGGFGGIPADVKAALEKHRPKSIAAAAPISAPAASAEVPKQTWKATGRVTDKEGKPMADVEIWVHTGMGSLMRTGFGKTDADGRYEVEFGLAVMMKKESAQLQFANITAHKAGFYETRLNRHGAGAAATREVPAEDLKSYNITAAALALPGKPREVNFEMAPAVRIKGRLVGTGSFPRLPPQDYRGKNEKLIAGHIVFRQAPLARWKVWLTGPQLAPATSVFASAETDEDGRFEFLDVPTGYEWQVQADTHHRGNDPRSPLFTVPPGADVTLDLELDEKQTGLKVLPATSKPGAAQPPREKPASRIFAEGAGPVTPLMAAAEAGNLQEVKRRLDGGEDPNARTSDKSADGALVGGITPLYAAAVRGHVDVVKALLDGGADLKAATTANGRFPLFEIIHTIEDDATLEAMMKLLLERGADPNQPDAKIGSALHFAVVQNKPAIVRQLVAAGAELDARSRDGKTPLGLAREQNLREMVELLVQLEKSAADAEVRDWPVVVVEAETGKPIAGAIAQVHLIRGNQRKEPPIQRSSDANGRITIPLRVGTGGLLQCSAPGWFGKWIILGQMPEISSKTAPDPQNPTRVELWRGTEVTGRLVQPDGTPLSGAALQVGVYIGNIEWKKRLSMDLGHYSWDHGEWPNWSVQVVTGADGRFEASVPPPEARSWVRVGTTELGFGMISPPAEPQTTGKAIASFAPFETEVASDRAEDAARVRKIDFGDLKLRRGVILRGRVLDADGQPLAGVHLMTSGKRGPYAGRAAVSGPDGTFAFLPMDPGSFTLAPDARLRGKDGQVASRDVLAVFVPQPVTLPDSDQPVQIEVRALPHVELEFEWMDRRAKKGPVSYYGEFPITGRVPMPNGEPVRWRGATELVQRGGREVLFLKVPRNLLEPTLSLPADKVVTASYEDPFVKSGPGQVVLQQIGEPVRRTIFGDEPKTER